MDRLLIDVAGTLTLRVYVAGVLTDLDAPPAVTVRDGAGVSLASGTATRVSAGTYSFIYTPTVLDQLRAVWTGLMSTLPTSFTTQAEVVGAIPITVAEVRGTDEDLSDTSKYPDAAVQAAIDQAVEQAERSMRVAIVPKGRRYSATGTGDPALVLPNLEIRALTAVTVDGLASDVDNYVALASGVIEGINGTSVNFLRGSALTFHYAHGWDFPPVQVVRAIRILAASYLVTSSLPSRATSLATDAGSFRITVAGRDGDTGLPEVDAVFAQFGYAAMPEFA